MFHWCRRSGLKREDAADVFQEVFASVAGGIDRFEQNSSRGTFRGWLRTITRNSIHDHFRKAADRPAAAGGTDAQQRLARVPDVLADNAIESDEEESHETSSLLHRGLELVKGEFEPRTWEAFWRATVEQERTADIATDLGITANNVRQAKSRVLRRLRQELGDLGEQTW